VPRTNIARLNNTGPATQSLTYSGSTINWLRGGTSPEAWRTTFESSTNGVDWTFLGAGNHIPGGWQVTNVPVAEGATIRARGFVPAVVYMLASGQSIVESTIQVGSATPPVIVTADSHFGVTSNKFGFNIKGQSSQVIVVEASTNLLQWLPLLTNTLSNGSGYFSDAGWRQRPRQFYRVRRQ
jgi:hypothetical protein